MDIIHTQTPESFNENIQDKFTVFTTQFQGFSKPIPPIVQASVQIRFNYYEADIKKSAPIGSIALDQFFEAIRNPKPEIKEIFHRIKQADLEGNKELKAQLKTRLFSFTPCVFIQGRRRYDDIKSFTGLMVLDFDKIEHAQELKEHMFYDYPFIIASWLSASGRGVRALVNIPIVSTVESFKSLFMGLEKEVMGKCIGFDSAPKNPVLPLFLSHDPDLLSRERAEVWNTTYEPPKPLPRMPQFVLDANPTRVQSIIKSKIGKIHDNGHPQLRAAAYSLGGYVGAGLIEHDQAVHYIEELINSNSYLSKGTDGYKRTAREMIIKGIKEPLFLTPYSR